MNTNSLQGTYISSGDVKPEWIDVNGHMNVAWYVLAFDLAVDSLWGLFGIDDDYINVSRRSTFAVESHVNYRQELLEGDPYIVHAQVLAYDEKRIHQFQYLYHAEKHFLAATSEWMNLHVDLRTRRVSPWPVNVLDKIATFANSQTDTKSPQGAGKCMSVKQPLYSVLDNQAT